MVNKRIENLFSDLLDMADLLLDRLLLSMQMLQIVGNESTTSICILYIDVTKCRYPIMVPEQRGEWSWQDSRVCIDLFRGNLRPAGNPYRNPFILCKGRRCCTLCSLQREMLLAAERERADIENESAAKKFRCTKFGFDLRFFYWCKLNILRVRLLKKKGILTQYKESI